MYSFQVFTLCFISTLHFHSNTLSFHIYIHPYNQSSHLSHPIHLQCLLIQFNSILSITESSLITLLSSTTITLSPHYIHLIIPLFIITNTTSINIDIIHISFIHIHSSLSSLIHHHIPYTTSNNNIHNTTTSNFNTMQHQFLLRE